MTANPLLLVARRWLLWIAVSWLPFSISADVGFRAMDDNGLEVGVWYPSDDRATAGRLGPFSVEYAFDGNAREGKWPVVLLSHGRNGRYRNHHLTAAALAQRGYIVVAPQHTTRAYGLDTRIKARVDDLQAALSMVKADPAFSAVCETREINAVGYSLGGASVIAAAGAGFDPQLIYNHCESNDDSEFCSAGLLEKLSIRIARLFASDENSPARFGNFINGSIAVVSPVGQGIVFPESGFAASRLMVVATDGDTTTPPEFHADYLANHAMAATTVEHHRIPGKHFAFIAPFPQWLQDEDQEVARLTQALEGMDHLAYIEQINRWIVDFLDGSRADAR